jgi:hypothetical protein
MVGGFGVNRGSPGVTVRARHCAGAITPSRALDKGIDQIDRYDEKRESVGHVESYDHQAKQPIKCCESDGSEHASLRALVAIIARLASRGSSKTLPWVSKNDQSLSCYRLIIGLGYQHAHAIGNKTAMGVLL